MKWLIAWSVPPQAGEVWSPESKQDTTVFMLSHGDSKRAPYRPLRVRWSKTGWRGSARSFTKGSDGLGVLDFTQQPDMGVYSWVGIPPITSRNDPPLPGEVGSTSRVGTLSFFTALTLHPGPPEGKPWFEQAIVAGANFPFGGNLDAFSK